MNFRTSSSGPFGILVCNRKGGVGKTTISTNLAATLAAAGHRTTLLDCDPQLSSMAWFERRPLGNAPLRVINASHAQAVIGTAMGLKIPPDTEFAIYDSRPVAAAHMLSDLLRRVQVVLVPLLPSPIDLAASEGFLADLRRAPECRRQGIELGVVANRIRDTQVSTRQLRESLDAWGFPCRASLQDTQLYVYASGTGLAVSELRTTRAESEQDQWRLLREYVEQAALAERTPRQAPDRAYLEVVR